MKAALDKRIKHANINEVTTVIPAFEVLFSRATCRLLRSTTLLKYAGIVVSIGENDEDRSRYLDIAATANMARRSRTQVSLSRLLGWSSMTRHNL